jgi:hypothetical protein
MWGLTTKADSTRRVCAECRSEIAADEPVIVETLGLRWRTTLARNPVLCNNDVVTHAGCASTRSRYPHLAPTA